MLLYAQQTVRDKTKFSLNILTDFDRQTLFILSSSNRQCTKWNAVTLLEGVDFKVLSYRFVCILFERLISIQIVHTSSIVVDATIRLTAFNSTVREIPKMSLSRCVLAIPWT